MAAAVLLRWLLDPWLGDTLPLATLFGAVGFAVWLGGLRPAWLTAALGYPACSWLFMEPRGSLGVLGARDLISVALYLLSCAVIIGLGESMRAANRRAQADLRQRLQAEEALREADRRKDEFLATLAHELRNPLSPIRTATEILRIKSPADPELRAARDIIDRQVRQMARLVDDLLDVARITRGKIQLRRERVELSQVVRDAVEAARPLIDASGHRLTVTLPREAVVLDADPTRLSQILLNLLNNAAKYTPRGGHIHLAAEHAAHGVTLAVRDDGIGIAAEHLPHVFDMFSQVEPALERSEGGLGIGLALVRGLVELHGGSIEARSDGPHRGSEFRIHLPVMELQPEARGESAGEPAPAAAKRRILVADDNRDAAEGLGLLLELMGHEVRRPSMGRKPWPPPTTSAPTSRCSTSACRR
jgi:signal transduction histidine kinase